MYGSKVKLLWIAFISAFKNLIGTDLEKCLRCICYATTFCNHLPNCVKAQITEKYWEEAGSPTLEYKKPSTETYRECMKDTNCVLNTLDAYTTGGGTNRVRISSYETAIKVSEKSSIFFAGC